eukprot:TRINITY_DN828_c0_g1_i1.p1 TRINITY_DN828_c0_g1~~TRINITY_DN828_c0_g1_i1.p1  ORF type:complete len:1057 (-),score=284.62 TRINITY_DN828_c0_g1_i1:80-3220(-)
MEQQGQVLALAPLAMPAAAPPAASPQQPQQPPPPSPHPNPPQAPTLPLQQQLVRPAGAPPCVVSVQPQAPPQHVQPPSQPGAHVAVLLQQHAPAPPTAAQPPHLQPVASSVSLPHSQVALAQLQPAQHAPPPSQQAPSSVMTLLDEQALRMQALERVPLSVMTLLDEQALQQQARARTLAMASGRMAPLPAAAMASFAAAIPAFSQIAVPAPLPGVHTLPLPVPLHHVETTSTSHKLKHEHEDQPPAVSSGASLAKQEVPAPPQFHIPEELGTQLLQLLQELERVLEQSPTPVPPPSQSGEAAKLEQFPPEKLPRLISLLQETLEKQQAEQPAGPKRRGRPRRRGAPPSEQPSATEPPQEKMATRHRKRRAAELAQNAEAAVAKAPPMASAEGPALPSAAEMQTEVHSASEAPKKKRGRPRKVPIATAAEASAEPAPPSPASAGGPTFLSASIPPAAVPIPATPTVSAIAEEREEKEDKERGTDEQEQEQKRLRHERKQLERERAEREAKEFAIAAALAGPVTRKRLRSQLTHPSDAAAATVNTAATKSEPTAEKAKPKHKRHKKDKPKRKEKQHGKKVVKEKEHTMPVRRYVMIVRRVPLDQLARCGMLRPDMPEEFLLRWLQQPQQQALPQTTSPAAPLSATPPQQTSSGNAAAISPLLLGQAPLPQQFSARRQIQLMSVVFGEPVAFGAAACVENAAALEELCKLWLLLTLRRVVTETWEDVAERRRQKEERRKAAEAAGEKTRRRRDRDSATKKPKRPTVNPEHVAVHLPPPQAYRLQELLSFTTAQKVMKAMAGDGETCDFGELIVEHLINAEAKEMEPAAATEEKLPAPLALSPPPEMMQQQPKTGSEEEQTAAAEHTRVDAAVEAASALQPSDKHRYDENLVWDRLRRAWGDAACTESVRRRLSAWLRAAFAARAAALRDDDYVEFSRACAHATFTRPFGHERFRAWAGVAAAERVGGVRFSRESVDALSHSLYEWLWDFVASVRRAESVHEGEHTPPQRMRAWVCASFAALRGSAALTSDLLTAGTFPAVEPGAKCDR